MSNEHRSGLAPDDYHKLTGFEGDWRDTWWDQDYLVFMAGQLGLPTRKRALDLGCGVGHWGQRLQPLMHADATLVGIDAEPAWMDRARERAEARGLQASYQVGNAAALPFEDDRFDLVTCQTLLMHVADPDAVLAEARRVLAPGGLMLAAEPNNVGSTAAHMVWEPMPDWSMASALIELEYTLGKGKEALGEGWSSVGERLPAAMARVGFQDVDVRLNNQCLPRIPPDYTHDRRSIEMLRETHNSGAFFGPGGTYENGLRQFQAAGGSAARFAELWAVAMAHQKRVLEAVDAGTHASAGGHLHYLVWGVNGG
jgi:2-polyprenyl-3-methyl-5-hydroxy-6-metoxy-1,4-benzoquinol methylase